MMASTWEPTSTDYLNALKDQNPWHELSRVPEPLYKPIRRNLADELWRTLSHPTRRYQVVLGPRRVGKSVALYQTVQSLIDSGVDARRVWHMRMDHPLLMHHELGGWVRAILKHARPDHRPLYLMIDEINYARTWDKWLKTFFDEKWPVQIVATSSSTAALQNRSLESGIGRWEEQFLTPYTFAEFLKLRGDYDCRIEAGPHLSETIKRVIASCDDMPSLDRQRERFLLVGGFPELLINDLAKGEDMQSALLRSQHTLRSEAVQRVAGMDLPQVFDIRNPIILERLLYLLGQHMCGLVNVSKLAGTLEISRQTIQQYVSYLEKAFLIFMVPNYSPKEEAIQRKSRKVFFMDGAVRNAALQRGLAPLSDLNEVGLLIENTAASHLYALTLQNGYRTFYWRDSKSREVDLVYGHPDDPLAFEITKSRSHHLRGLRALEEQYPKFQGRCYLISATSGMAVTPENSEDGVGRLPLDLFLLAVSIQIRDALYRRLWANT